MYPEAIAFMEIFNNHIDGILFLAFVIILSLITWKKVKQHLIGQALITIVILGLGLRSYIGLDFRLHDWDEQYHALIAKHLADHPLKPTLYDDPVFTYDSKNWVGNHIWLEKPPVALWGMALSIKIFGTSAWAIRLPSLIYGLLGIVLTYGIGSRLFDKKIGIFAAYLYAINGVIIELGAGRISSDHVETALIFYVQLAIFLAIYFSQTTRSYSGTILIGLVTGIAFLSKWYPSGIIIPVWILSFLLLGKTSFKDLFIHSLLFFISFILIVTPWILFIGHSYPNESQIIFDKFLNAYSAPVENHSAPWYYYLHKIMVLFGELIYVVIAFAVYQLVKKNKRSEILILIAWIAIPILIFSFGETRRFSYLLITAPAFFILTSHFWFAIYAKIKSASTSTKWFTYIVLSTLILLPLRLTIERLKPFETIRKEDYPFYQNLALYEKMLGPKDVVFGSDQYIRLMFFTDVAAVYSNYPETGKIDSLKASGYRVYCMNGLELVQQ